ncbi:MAG: insulinase family protein, partial [Planctomycetes bacterium]|nr:insulinase family protein [Planctomycetota bacterium]
SRIIQGEANVSSQEMVVAWRTVGMEHNDQVILDIIAEYLQSPQSPLRQALEQTQLAESLEVHNRVFTHVPGYIEIRYRLRGDNRSVTMQKLKEVLGDVQKNGIPVEHLAAINLHLQRKISQLGDNAQLTAQDLLQWEMSVASPNYGVKLRKQYAQVTSDHVQRAANYFLNANRICLLSLRPASQVEAGGNEEYVVGPRAITSVPPRKQQLSNGIHVIERQLPMDLVYVTLSLGSGSVDDEKRLHGIGTLLSRCVTLQTDTRSRQDLQRLLSKNGMTLDAHNSRHSLQLSMSCFPKDIMLAIGVLADCISRPKFQDSDIHVARQHMLEELAFRQSDVTWQSLLNKHMHSLVFRDHYAGNTSLGDRTSLMDIDSQALFDHLSAQVRGANIVLSIYGSYDRANTKKLLHAHIANELFFPPGPRQQPFGATWSGITAQTASIKGDVDAFACAWPAPAIDDPLSEQVAMDVLLAMLSGADGGGGRLAETRRKSKIDPFVELEQFSERYHSRGMWNLQAQVHPDTIGTARELIIQTVNSCVADLQSDKKIPELEAEIKIAKSLCATIHALQDADQGQTIRLHAQSLLQYGNLDPVLMYRKKLLALKREDIALIAQKFLTSEPFFVQMAPEKKAIERVEKSTAPDKINSPK